MSFVLQKHVTSDWLTQCSMEATVPVLGTVSQFSSQGAASLYSIAPFTHLDFIKLAFFLKDLTFQNSKNGP